MNLVSYVSKPFKHAVQQARRQRWIEARRAQSDREYEWERTTVPVAYNDRIIIRAGARLPDQQATVKEVSEDGRHARLLVHGECPYPCWVIATNLHIRPWDADRDGPWVAGEQLFDPATLSA